MADLTVLSHYAKDGYYVVYTTSYSDATRDQYCITVNNDAMNQLNESTELKLAVDKRFKGKRTQYGLPNYLDLIVWSVCCHNYSVCEDAINNCTDRDILLAWEFIDTFSISSSESTRGVFSQILDSRSSSGFRRHIATQANHLQHKSPRRSKRFRLELQQPKLCKGNHTHDSLMLLIEEDINATVKKSSDQLLVAVAISEYIKESLV